MKDGANKVDWERDHLFTLIAEYAIRKGETSISKKPGLWVQKLDENWTITVNPHMEPLETEGGTTVQPGDCYVEYGGLPAGIFNFIDGAFAAGWALNEQEFRSALKAAAERAG